MKRKQTHVKQIAWIVLAVIAIILPLSCGDEGGEDNKAVAVTEVRLDQHLLFMALDPVTHKTAQLKATVIPGNATNNTVKWELKDASEDGVISIIQSGNTLNITAEKTGTVTVVAKDSGLGTRSAECQVTVVASWKAVTGVSLDSILEVNEGKRKSLTATVDPSDATDNLVKWEIIEGLANITIEDYATLSGSFTDNHTISVAGREQGTAKIKVTTQDGDFSQICDVTINPPVPVPYKLVVRNLRAGELNAATTPDNDSIEDWLGSTWTGSLNITNTESAHAGNDRPPVNTTIAYVYPPICGSFSWEIKATITGGTTGGLMVSRFLNAADFVPSGNGGQGTRLPDIVGISHMGSPAVRTVFPRNDGTTMNSTNPGGTVATLPIGTEYIYRVTWNAVLKTTKLEIVSDTTTLLTTDIGPSTSWSVDSVQTFLADSNPIQNSDAAFYPAFWISNNSVTITSMKVLVEGDEIETASISIRDKQDTQLGINNTRKLTVDFTPQDATFQGVAWESSDPLIATVGKHSGVVTGIADGSATITATPAIGGSPDSFTITVAKIPVQSVSIQTAAGATTAGQQFAHGEPLQLRAIITPANASDQTVTWESSNPTAASIGETSGLVTLNAEGTTEITATADGVTSSVFVVTVDKAVVTGITIDQKTGATPLTLYEDESIMELTATVKPDALGHEDKAVKWSSSNTAMATVGEDTGIVTYVAPGNVTITATSVGKNAADQPMTDTVVINVTAGPGPGLKLHVKNMAETPADGTTPNTAGGKTFLTLTETKPGAEWIWSGRKEIQNFSNAEFSGGIQNATVLYLTTPVEGKFTWTGKITLNGSANRGCGPALGVFINIPNQLPPSATMDTPLYFMGSAFYSNQNVRWLFTNKATAGNNTRADSTSAPATNTCTRGVEYDYTVKWDGEKYTLTFSSYSFDVVSTNANVNEILYTGSKYPGLFFQGPAAVDSTMTITSLKLTKDD